MNGIQQTSLPLATGVTLNVALAGDPANPPVILLHGFPESHRTWRHQIPALAERYFVIAPDQRGYANSSKPDGVEAYAADKIAADVFALADALVVDRFTLVGHDWGGAIAWMAALREPKRVARLAIVNAPHPQVFQRKLFDDPGQRRASQYIRFFRETELDRAPDKTGLEQFLLSLFGEHLQVTVPREEQAIYLEQWSQPGALTAMLNWYRATQIVVPAMDEDPPRPSWIDGPFPLQPQPTLVIWGMRDRGLLPCLLDGLETLIPDYRIVQIRDAGHFAPWEKPEEVTSALLEWLAARPAQ
ncbi:alpha/beta hydrolase [Sphingomonas sp. ABOLE]|uniref:alpha/beta fold hydrolase n=1 Tax=Sphingomonas sp. ABOLE TaxID=1985878 RepID=UPI000F7EA699|nr:alpha/beta hydrolase [Sphingomonas sp. ABOLE]RSV43871.1 alpha/beta hydrolase [Sphingomonas sp. ABOLE]